MPKVGSKHFGYGPSGIKAAKAESKRTGKKLVMTQPIYKTPKKK